MQTKPLSELSNFRPPDDMLSPSSLPHPLRSPKSQTFHQTSDFGQKIENQSNQMKNKEFFQNQELF